MKLLGKDIKNLEPKSPEIEALSFRIRSLELDLLATLNFDLIYPTPNFLLSELLNRELVDFNVKFKNELAKKCHPALDISSRLPLCLLFTAEDVLTASLIYFSDDFKVPEEFDVLIHRRKEASNLKDFEPLVQMIRDPSIENLINYIK